MPWESDWVAISGALWKAMTPVELARLTGIPVERVAQRLASMEQKNSVRKVGGELWERCD